MDLEYKTFHSFSFNSLSDKTMDLEYKTFRSSILSNFGIFFFLLGSKETCIKKKNTKKERLMITKRYIQ